MTSWSPGIRARLFIGYAVALTICCSLIAVIVYLGVRFLPTYQLSTVVVVDTDTSVVAPTRNALDVSRIEDVWGVLLVVSVVTVLVVLTLGLAVGWSMSRRMLSPLEQIADAAERAASGDLSSRIGAQGPHDELRRLADTFDDTMERLEASFDAQRQFTANASHELLTPLATTSGLLELLPDADPGEQEELIAMLHATNQRNILLVKQLLELARANRGMLPQERVDLAATVDAVTAEQRHPGCDIAYTGGGKSVVHGDALLLHQLVWNVVQNAVAHNVEGGWVRIEIAEDEAGVELRVENTGTRIPHDDAQRLLEPFQRGQQRTYDGDHHGLGLALVRAVADAHHAELTLTPRTEGGLIVAVRFPPYARASQARREQSI